MILPAAKPHLWQVHGAPALRGYLIWRNKVLEEKHSRDDNIEAGVDEDFIETLASEEEDADASSAATRYDLVAYPADFTLEVLHQKMKNRDIAIPPMQRQYVWTQNQASRLIESFLLGLPVPPVFMYAEKGSEKLMVVDGQQRLKTIMYFFDKQFGEEKHGRQTVFRLRLGEGSKYDGKTIEDISDEDVRYLKRQVLRSFVMKQVDPKDDTSIYHVFERLNTGGTPLALQEVRNCVYNGEFNRLLHDLNKSDSWRSILGKLTPDKRLRDVELILRFLALYEWGADYRKPMKDFLRDFMKFYRKGEKNDEFRTIFSKVAENISSNLGEKPFHVKAGLNAAVFDSVFVAFAKKEGDIPPDIKDRYNALVSEESFLNSTSVHTTDVEVVRERLDIAYRRLFG